jgi:hypothetical protein
MPKYLYVVAAAVSALLVAAPGGLAEAAPSHVLTIGKVGGTAVSKGAVLFASLAPKTMVTVTQPGQKLTCKSATVTAKVVSNPTALGHQGDAGQVHGQRQGRDDQERGGP